MLAGVVLLAAALSLAGAAEPLLASGPAVPPVIRIPGDHPLPDPGARVVVAVPPGAEIRVDPAAVDLAQAGLSLAGADLVLRPADGGVLVLKDFFAVLSPPATLVLGEAVLPADLLLAQLAPMADELPVEAAAGPVAGGGGELFGLLQVVSWLIERVELVPGAVAAEEAAARQLAQAGAPPAAGQAEPPRFAQMRAQLLIAREAEIARLAVDYETVTATLLAQLHSLIAVGHGGRLELAQAGAFHLEAQLEARDAGFRLAQAVDAHQDAHGERLETAAFPVWSTPPPTGLAAVSAEVAEGERAAARRYWRQARHARETISLLESLIALAEEIRDAYRQQFEIGQRTLAELETAEKTVFQAQVRLVQRRAELLIAEAWLLAATGQLSDDHIKRPGWQ